MPLAGWTKWTVPAATYLAADCSQTEYGDVFRCVTEQYLPEHGLSMTGAAFEYYPEPGNPNCVQLLFPIAQGSLYCQSCGMPMLDEKMLGTGKDGGPDYDYCCYCRRDGAFTDSRTMAEMIDFCLKCDCEAGRIGEQDVKEKKKSKLLQWFPTLKRWKTAE